MAQASRRPADVAARREVIVRLYREGRSVSEIAAAVGCHHESVRHHLMAAGVISKRRRYAKREHLEPQPEDAATSEAPATAYDRCPRCHLLGAHVCVEGIDEFAGQRRERA